MIFRKTLRSMIAMSEGAWLITLRGMQLGCALLLGAIVLLIDCGGDLITNYRQYWSPFSPRSAWRISIEELEKSLTAHSSIEHVQERVRT